MAGSFCEFQWTHISVLSHSLTIFFTYLCLGIFIQGIYKQYRCCVLVEIYFYKW